GFHGTEDGPDVPVRILVRHLFGHFHAQGISQAGSAAQLRGVIGREANGLSRKLAAEVGRSDSRSENDYVFPEFAEGGDHASLYSLGEGEEDNHVRDSPYDSEHRQERAELVGQNTGARFAEQGTKDLIHSGVLPRG